MSWLHEYRWRILRWSSALLIIIFFLIPPSTFEADYSTVVEARNGELLTASIASDGQWRFPEADSVPDKFATAIITFEDKRFYDHPGIDVLALARAIKQNISTGKIASGASTITMQVIRLSRKNKSRTLIEKIQEIALAARLDLHLSKENILRLYAAHAPFGGNVVGLEAASWRYFGTDPFDLSWAQAAMLAVLPNAPSLIHPGKNRALLFKKRNALLKKLFDEGKFDEVTYSLAIQEPIPDEPTPLPRNARHLLSRISHDGKAQKKVRSTINHQLQIRTEQIIEDHHQRLAGNQIHNAAALVLDVKTGEVLAYAGNINQPGYHESEVDVIASPRSTGSILKPFLYATMLDEGKLLPKMLLPDAPLLINGFAPHNFSHAYDGVVPANQALIRSLNVPAVHLLRKYRYEKFHALLSNMGMTTLRYPADHYGLSLILGGAEATLWDITSMYASMARTLNNYFDHPGSKRYNRKDFHSATYVTSNENTSDKNLTENSWLGASSIYLTFDALKELYRPGEESGWKHFNSSKKIAWKTGTSFGFRDGWAVGVTPDYVVGVWVGNADGEGRPGLTGTDAAAPLMFDVFSQLPGNSWFAKPQAEMIDVVTCAKSGFRLSSFCTDADTISITKNSFSEGVCPYHKRVHLTPDSKFQVHDGCESLTTINHVNWFVLPPVLELYYRRINLSYKSLPPFRADCQAVQNFAAMDLVYPKNKAKVFIPRELDGSPGRSVFELAHRNPKAKVFWHLDGKYIGSTQGTHHLALNPGEGKHTLIIIDEEGQILERDFEIISKF